MKRLVFGGSFNPVHNGHVALLAAINEAVKPDVTTIVPAYLPVHKEVGGDYADPAHRLAMCRLAFAGPGVEISDWEIAQGRACYTIETLTALKEAHPEDELYLVCGSDMFLTFDLWRQYTDIYRIAVICAASRGDRLSDMAAYAKAQEPLGMRCLLSDAEPVVVSSTQVRERLRAGADVSDLVPSAVLAYIRANGLYREEA